MQGGKGQLGLIDHGVGGIEHRILREMSQRFPWRWRLTPGIDGQLADQDPEQRCFSAAVVADQADAFAAVDGEAEPLSNSTRRPKVFSMLLRVAMAMARYYSGTGSYPAPARFSSSLISPSASGKLKRCFARQPGQTAVAGSRRRL